MDNLSSTDSAPHFRDARVFLFDLDGCVYYTNILAQGADKVIDSLRNAGIKVGFVTNNSRQSARDIAIKLLQMGLPVTPEEIVTATECTGTYLAEKYGPAKVKVVGSAGLCTALQAAGHRLLAMEAAEPAEFIVVGRDTAFSYAKLAWTAREADRGARVIAANPDLFHPGEEGARIPETGALTAAIQAVIGCEIEYVGKPAAYLFHYGMKKYDAEPHQCVMVGDNYDTDITGGHRAGMKTVWIDNRDDDRHGDRHPDYPMADLIIRRIWDLQERMQHGLS